MRHTLARTCLVALVAAPWLLVGTPALAAQTSTGTPVVLGALDAGAVDAAVQPRIGALHACTVAALKVDPDVYGIVAVRLKIHSNGSVSEATVRASTMGDQVIEGCMRAALADVEVPVLEGGREAIAVVPVVLTPHPVITPRTRLQQRLEHCTDGGPAASATTRTVLARVDVESGRATKVVLEHLAEVDDGAAACIQEALEIGPHRMGTGPRFYEWDLPG